MTEKHFWLHDFLKQQPMLWLNMIYLIRTCPVISNFGPLKPLLVDFAVCQPISQILVLTPSHSIVHSCESTLLPKY